jgi:hypothetical protein
MQPSQVTGQPGDDVMVMMMMMIMMMMMMVMVMVMVLILRRSPGNLVSVYVSN